MCYFYELWNTNTNDDVFTRYHQDIHHWNNPYSIMQIKDSLVVFDAIDQRLYICSADKMFT